MVVPVERVVRPQNPKRYVGNNLTLNIDENKSSILLTGNNCKVTLEENNGKVKVVGDNCEIVIRKGNGNVKYVGNCGKIFLGIGVSSDKVDYVGNRGNVTSVSGNNGAAEEKTTTCDINENRMSERRVINVRKSTNPKKNINITNCSTIRMAASCVPDNLDLPLRMVRSDGCIRYQVLSRK